MSRVLLVSNHIFHYRIKVYNFFAKEFKNNGHDFMVISSSMDKVEFDVKFKNYILKNNILVYLKFIFSVKPDIIITFLHLSNIIYLPILIYCKVLNIKLIIWSKSIDIKKPNNILKNFLFSIFHKLSDSIILYTPNELRYLNVKYHSKTFIGFNALSFEDVEKDKTIEAENIKKKYNIVQENIILFVATLNKKKGLDLIIDAPLSDDKICVVIVGSGITDDQLSKISNLNNYYYIGKLPFDDIALNELFRITKVYISPMNIGLAINQSFFWGKPVVVLEGFHSVEIYYLRDGKNGYIAKNMGEFWSYVQKLVYDEEVYNSFKFNCIKTFNEEANIKKMFNGFLAAIEYVEKKYI